MRADRGLRYWPRPRPTRDSAAAINSWLWSPSASAMANSTLEDGGFLPFSMAARYE